MFQITETWKAAYPDAHAGVLMLRDAANPTHDAELEKRKAALEDELRARFAGQDRAALLRHPILQAYDAYYRRFKKTYHVQLQLEFDPLQRQINSICGDARGSHVHG